MTASEVVVTGRDVVVTGSEVVVIASEVVVTSDVVVVGGAVLVVEDVVVVVLDVVVEVVVVVTVLVVEPVVVSEATTSSTKAFTLFSIVPSSFVVAHPATASRTAQRRLKLSSARVRQESATATLFSTALA